ncbi:hypothetical protein X777_03961 [Ooceraea biroi]|uniref:Uncharacterized protein n=1 Tax=Ooceraea biroi TaxID=2015173 RepID=A0A026WJD3_OOCBI|nr:hypothetical protein X777_03961 [Ooceraea biroi]
MPPESTSRSRDARSITACNHTMQQSSNRYEIDHWVAGEVPRLVGAQPRREPMENFAAIRLGLAAPRNSTIPKTDPVGLIPFVGCSLRKPCRDFSRFLFSVSNNRPDPRTKKIK